MNETTGGISLVVGGISTHHDVSEGWPLGPKKGVSGPFFLLVLTGRTRTTTNLEGPNDCGCTKSSSSLKLGETIVCWYFQWNHHSMDAIGALLAERQVCIKQRGGRG